MVSAMDPLVVNSVFLPEQQNTSIQNYKGVYIVAVAAAVVVLVVVTIIIIIILTTK
jgi:hypothetical protein